MDKRNEMLIEILSDPILMEKYNIKESDLENLKTTPPYINKITEVLATIINDNDNHMSSLMIYRKIKNIHKIG